MTIQYAQPAVERAMKVQEVILRATAGRISWVQAAEILGVSPRQMRRWRRRYEEHGYDGLFDRRRKQPSPKRVPMPQVTQVLELYRERYLDFNVKHFHEKLVAEHQIQLSYSWVKTALQTAGLVCRKAKRGKHRRRRERRPLAGMLLHLDGSTHPWFGLEHPACDLLVLLDDATSEVYAASFVPQEDTRSVLGLLRRVVETKGTFCSLYTDRASHFVYTPEAGQGPDRSRKTQVERALDQLGIELIAAHSPQARGRGERLWRTWQGRLPQELRVAGVVTMEEGNRYLETQFIQWHNQSIVVAAKESGTAFVAVARADLNRIFSLHHERIVGNDNVVQFGGMKLQIKKSDMRFSFAKCRVRVYEQLDGTITLGYGPHTLGHYSPDGQWLAAEQRQAA